MTLLEGKTALVTGGTRGIGKAIAKLFAEQGATVAICGTNAKLGEEVAKEISAKFYQVDLSKPEAIQTFCEAVIADFGVPSIIVNNAGITRDQLLMKLSTEDWDAVLNTNLTSVFHLCKAFIRPLLKARAGKIINITSVVGLTGNAGQTNYAAAKSGMIGFTRSLAKEVAARGITANCIAPGFIKSDMTDKLTDDQKKAILTQVPMGRLGQPEEIARTALFLASDMADYITGQVLTVDGGMVMA